MEQSADCLYSRSVLVSLSCTTSLRWGSWMHYKADLRHMSLAVTEVMLTMRRWLRGDWRVFTALLLKGSNLESSNFPCKKGKNVETVVGKLPKA